MPARLAAFSLLLLDERLRELTGSAIENANFWQSIEALNRASEFHGLVAVGAERRLHK
jgi:hypothetical protein